MKPDPKYTKPYQHTRKANIQEQQRLLKIKQEINTELNNTNIELTSQYTTELETIKKNINNNNITLTQTFLLCINELQNKNEHQKILALFQDLENLPTYYYDYTKKPTPHTKNKITQLTTPYIQEMKHLITVCEKIFTKEEDILAQMEVM